MFKKNDYKNDKTMLQNLEAIDIVRDKLLQENRELNEYLHYITANSKLQLELSEYIKQDTVIKAIIAVDIDLALMFVDDLAIFIDITDNYIQKVFTCIYDDVTLVYNSN